MDEMDEKCDGFAKLALLLELPKSFDSHGLRAKEQVNFSY